MPPGRPKGDYTETTAERVARFRRRQKIFAELAQSWQASYSHGSLHQVLSELDDATRIKITKAIDEWLHRWQQKVVDVVDEVYAEVDLPPEAREARKKQELADIMKIIEDPSEPEE